MNYLYLLPDTLTRNTWVVESEHRWNLDLLRVAIYEAGFLNGCDMRDIHEVLTAQGIRILGVLNGVCKL